MEWLWLIIAIVLTLALFFIVGFLLYLYAKKVRVKSSDELEKIAVYERNRISETLTLAKQVELPKSIASEVDTIEFIDPHDEGYRGMRDKVDFMLRIIVKVCNEKEDVELASKAKQLYDESVEIYTKYNKIAMTYNSLAKIPFVAIFIKIKHLEALPIF